MLISGFLPGCRRSIAPTACSIIFSGQQAQPPVRVMVRKILPSRIMYQPLVLPPARPYIIMMWYWRQKHPNIRASIITEYRKQQDRPGIGCKQSLLRCAVIATPAGYYKRRYCKAAPQFKDATARYQAGVVDKTDYKQATISLNNALASHKQTEEAIKSKTAYLKQVMGYNPDRRIILQLRFCPCKPRQL
jgi:hypothetical protein